MEDAKKGRRHAALQGQFKDVHTNVRQAIKSVKVYGRVY